MVDTGLTLRLVVDCGNEYRNILKRTFFAEFMVMEFQILI